MSYQKYIKFLFVGCLLLTGIVVLINFIVDPLWTFSHKNIFNAKQLGFDERQQKTNYVYFNDLKQYEGIILGSSRSAFIDQNDFLDMNLYNYSVNSMMPSEYIDYLNFAKEAKGKNLKYIAIGVDFFGTNANKESGRKEPYVYINKTKSFMYRYKMLFSFDVLIKSINNIKRSFRHPRGYYSRDNIIIRRKNKKTIYNTKNKMNTFFGKRYKWNKNYFNIFKQIKKSNPNTKLMIFTAPVVADLFVSIMQKANRINEYKKWIRGLVDIFGEIYCFMGINSITTNLQHFKDADHFYPHIGKIIANKISTNNFDMPPKDFGVVVNKDNVEHFLKKQEEQIKAYKFSDDYPKEEVDRMLR